MYKTGLGYDIHQLVENRPLILGGITIPFEKGLKGHSDADCLIHAIVDAILGAAGLGDIGEFYPDNDPINKNLDSQIILKETFQKIKGLKYKIINLDTNILCQNPKLSPYKNEIKSNLSRLLNIDIKNINIKAKTKEKLDSVGQGLAIECQAIVLLKKEES